MRLLIAVGSFAVGCSPDLCGRMARRIERCDIETTGDAKNTCETSIVDCTAEDESELHEFVDCLEEAEQDSCENDATATSTDVALKERCYNDVLEQLSAACVSSMFSYEIGVAE